MELGKKIAGHVVGIPWPARRIFKNQEVSCKMNGSMVVSK